MSLGFSMENFGKKEQFAAALSLAQCDLCPLRARKTFIDPPITPCEILVISAKTPFTITSSDTGVTTRHIYTNECSYVGEDNLPEQSNICCGSRKADYITQARPSVVVCIGQEAFSLVEELCKNNPPGLNNADDCLMPSSLNGHNFWVTTIPDFNVRAAFLRNLSMIKQGLSTKPYIPVSRIEHLKGIEFVTETRLVKPAFASLSTALNAVDLETTGFRPYPSTAKILSMAVGDNDRTFVFPLFHAETPSNFSAIEVLNEFQALCKRSEMIAHNAVFELEWLTHLYGDEIGFYNTWHDTMAQAFLLNSNPEIGKSLDWQIRKYFGFSLKNICPVDTSELRNTPLSQVLEYNAYDTKYTYKLFKKQEPEIANQFLPYPTQIERIPAIALMQNRGVVPNHIFIQAESAKQEKIFEEANRKILTTPEVIAFIEDNHTFNPASDDDVALLFHKYLGVPTTVESFDKDFLKSHPAPSAPLLIEAREAYKIFGTYLSGVNAVSTHKDGGKYLYPDGLIHAIFNSMKTATARLSSDTPNMQNWPKRGGKKYVRNAITVPTGHYFVAIDFGQIEYRMIAALSRDLKMISAILNGLDIHAWWANRLDQLFPGYFLHKKQKQCEKKRLNDKSAACDCESCEFKEFRDRCKNELVFPYCFGGSDSAVGQRMKIYDQAKMEAIGQEFWSEHKRVKDWQNEQNFHLNQYGYILNGLGRRFREPLSFNQTVNYPIQSSASDIVVAAMSRLARESIKRKMPWLCPVINIHDDLSFYIPCERLAEALQIILEVMLDVRPYPWLPVPLTAEVSYGTEWGSLDVLGTFSSHTIYGIPGAIPGVV